MDTLGEDLVLLALRPNGTMHAQQKLRFALAGSELVRLAAAGRVDLVYERILVGDARETGDPLLDDALADMRRRGETLSAEEWVARARPGLRERYLRSLEAKGVVRIETHRALGLFRVSRWYVVDDARARQARARLDEVAASSGAPTPEQVAFAGLVHAAGLDTALYAAGSGAAARARLRQLAARRQAAAPALNPQDAAMFWSVDTVVRASSRAARPDSGHGSNAGQHNGHHTAHHSGGTFDHSHHGGFDGGAGGGHH
jgi:hypothetical protein